MPGDGVLNHGDELVGGDVEGDGPLDTLLLGAGTELRFQGAVDGDDGGDTAVAKVVEVGAVAFVELDDVVEDDVRLAVGGTLEGDLEAGRRPVPGWCVGRSRRPVGSFGCRPRPTSTSRPLVAAHQRIMADGRVGRYTPTGWESRHPLARIDGSPQDRALAPQGRGTGEGPTGLVSRHSGTPCLAALAVQQVTTKAGGAGRGDATGTATA